MEKYSIIRIDGIEYNAAIENIKLDIVKKNNKRIKRNNKIKDFLWNIVFAFEVLFTIIFIATIVSVCITIIIKVMQLLILVLS